MFSKNTLKNLSDILLVLIVPILFCITGIYVIGLFGPLHLRHGDPDYIYLLSGLSMGNLHLNVGHVDNPGTPLQILVAIVTRIVHLFAGKGPYFEDLLTRPDFYLHKVLITNYLICSGFLVFAGRAVAGYFKNIFYAPLIQTVFFISWAVFFNTTTVIPEVIIIVPVVLLLIQISSHYNTTPPKSLNSADIIKLALIGGFGVAIKLDYLGLIFLPVFLFKNWKHHAIYWPGIILSFLVFAFPVINKRKFFFEWIQSLFLHTGKYGSGESTIISRNDFVLNFKQVLNLFDFYYFVFALLLLALILLIIRNRKQGFTTEMRVFAGISLTVLFQTLLVSKHFGSNYMMPVVYLMPFFILLVIEVSVIIIPIKKVAALVFTGLLLFNFCYKSSKDLGWLVPELAHKQEVFDKVRKLKEAKAFVIVDQPFDYFFQESPLLFGWFFQGNYRFVIKEKLDKIYPETYVWDGGKKKFFLWGDLFDASEILDKNGQIDVFVNGRAFNEFNEAFSKQQGLLDIDTLYVDSRYKHVLLKIVTAEGGK